jgi:thiol-disulfide isomerase/thioredoxin
MAMDPLDPGLPGRQDPAPGGGWRRFRQGRAFRALRDSLIFLAVLLAVGAWQTRRHVRGPPPEVALRTLAGEPFALASLRGKPAMVAFWAPWCGVCKAQSDNVSRALRLAGGRAHGVSVAASYEDEAEVRRHVREQGIDVPVLLADDAALGAFRVEAFPTVYFLDADGRVKGSAAGYTTTLGMLARLLL